MATLAHERSQWLAVTSFPTLLWLG